MQRGETLPHYSASQCTLPHYFTAHVGNGSVLNFGCVLAIGYLHCGCFMENAETWVNGIRKTRSKNTENLKQVYGKLEKRLAATLVW